VAQETCPRVSYLPNYPPQPHQLQPQVYLPRRCCLQKYVKHYYDQDTNPPDSSTRWFSISNQRDAVTVTTTLPKKSVMHQGGVVYTQIYATWKTILDAAAYYL
jgi:hypothetical protein